MGNSLEIGGYARYAAVTLSGLILFFMGTLQAFMEGYELIPIFALFLLTAIISFHNKTPSGGILYGVFTSVSFLLGQFLSIVIVELSLLAGGSGALDEGFPVFVRVVSVYVPNMVAFAVAFASLGLFFGLLGYIFGRSSPDTVLNAPRSYRDYWSSIHHLGKSEKREYSDLDRRFSSWSATKKGWWKGIASGIAQPAPDLFFLPRKIRKGSNVFGSGDLYDLSTGRMLGNGLVNPTDLVAKYRPFVLKIPEYSTKAKGVRRLAFENILKNFLKRVVPSKAVFVFFVVLSGLFVSSAYLGKMGSISFFMTAFSLVVGIALSAATLLLAWSWGNKSKELFEKRPDERLLILVVYVVLALLYGFFYQMSLNLPLPSDPADRVAVWGVWIGWFFALSFVLGLSYILIHREVEVVNTYFYDNRKPAGPVVRSSAYKDPADEPFWLKQEKVESYWVIRFMYFWRYEIAKVPHSDWERVELWVDAANGALKWVVSDYHYRELWYKVKGELDSLYVSFFVNFHTPVPVLEVDEANAISKALNRNARSLLATTITGRSKEIVEELNRLLDNDVWKKLHPAEWITDFGLKNVAAGFSSKLPWRFWRYPHGLEAPERYLDEPAAKPEDNPSRVDES